AGLTGRGGGAGAGGDTAATTGGGGRGRASRCDSVPDKFGAAAAAKVEAAARADSIAGRTRGRPGALRDSRAQKVGAVGVLLVALDSAPRNTVNAIFDSRMGMQLTPAPDAPAGAAISRAAAATLFGKPLDQLSIGATGQPI